MFFAEFETVDKMTCKCERCQFDRSKLRRLNLMIDLQMLKARYMLVDECKTWEYEKQIKRVGRLVMLISRMGAQ